MPCGSPIPAGASCVCNCVKGTATLPESAPAFAPSMRSGGTYCSCDKVCVCVPVMRCQAHELLHPDAAIRCMAEERLLIAGHRAADYLAWAASTATVPLREAIHHLMQNIDRGRPPDSVRWPDTRTCLANLDGPRVIPLLAAQWLRRIGAKALVTDEPRVQAILRDAIERPWQELARHGGPTSPRF